MTAAQAHRGPDGAGHVFFETRDLREASFTASTGSETRRGKLALGHRRLSIIDVNERSAQPMAYAAGNYWITYNGELYNFIELRKELAGLGHAFRTESDTEVILASYAQWGLDCFKRFNGMWALAIWDATSRSLILCRDRFGIKPLHYAIDNGSLWFSSEIKGILASDEIPAHANGDVLYSYLAHGLVNTGPETFFSNVHTLPAGSYAVVTPEHITVTPIRYWHLKREGGLDSPTSFEEACDRFRELLSSAITLQMRSDVPVGACLSGGLDSSSIVSLMTRLAAAPPHAFTAGFEDPRFDESRWAQIVVDQLELRGLVVRPTEQGLIDSFESLVWHQEEPFTTASLYAQWLVISKASESGVKVLLDGQGADEILAGYLKYYAFYIQTLARQRKYFASTREAVNLLWRGDRGYFNVSNVVRYMPGFISRRSSGLLKHLRPNFGPRASRQTVSLGVESGISERQILDIEKFSLPSLLRYEDRNSMAWSVESRVPFLDHRLVDFLIGLPEQYKFRGGRSKAVLRGGMRGVVPIDILNRRDKMGFITPQSEWMKSGLGQFIESRCRASASTLNHWVDVESVLSGWRRPHEAKAPVDQSIVFRLGVLAQWVDSFKVAPPHSI